MFVKRMSYQREQNQLRKPITALSVYTICHIQSCSVKIKKNKKTFTDPAYKLPLNFYGHSRCLDAMFSPDKSPDIMH